MDIEIRKKTLAIDCVPDRIKEGFVDKMYLWKIFIFWSMPIIIIIMMTNIKSQDLQVTAYGPPLGLHF